VAKRGTIAALAIAAVAAFAITSKKSKKKTEDDVRAGEDDWGVPDSYELTDSGTYVGLTGQAQYRIYEDPEGYFAFEWRADEKDGGGNGYPTQDEAGDALWDELEDQFGPEQHPETGEPPVMPEEERPPEPEPDPEIPAPPEPAGKDDWGISTANELVDTGQFRGQKAEAIWRIYAEPAGTFLYSWKSQIGGGAKKGFATQEDAGNAAFDHMAKLGPYRSFRTQGVGDP
jgi:hypothetical protein